MDNNPQDVDHAIERVNQLGNASEKLFNRFYAGLRKKPAGNENAPLPAEIAQAQLLVERNQRLMQALRQRELEVERLSGVLAKLNEGIIMQDTEGQLILMNDAAKDMIGSEKNFWESELGRMFDAFRDVHTLEHEVMPLSETIRVEINRKVLGAQIAAVADANNTRIGSMIILRDITTDSLATRLKDQFITAISHELRTPMTVIKGASEVIAGSPDAQQVNRRLLDTLTRNVDILDRMVVELLDLSEISAGSFTIRDEQVNLEELFWSVINGMIPEIKKAKLDIMVMMRDQHKLYIRGDPSRMRWAIGHILQNAIRYTEAGGHITVAVGLDEQNDDYITTDIIDTGVGIMEKDLPHVFDRFYRGEPRSLSGKLLDPRGLGQGLYIAQTVITAHGGTLTLHSERGAGSCFTLMLPRIQPE